MLTNKIEQTIEKYLGESIQKVKEINAGLNNRLFKVVTSKRNYLIKLYRKDAEVMLKREFDAFKYLRKKNILNVPMAYFKNSKQNFAIYSFEEGKTKIPSQATKGDLDKMAYFIAGVHKLQPRNIRKKFLPANFACFSINDYLKNIYFRLEKFSAYANSKDIPEIIDKLKKERVDTTIKKLIQKVVNGIPNRILNKKLGVNEEKLSPVDFGLHNILFGKDGSLCFIDFEYFGRDDPARAVADFLTHDRSVEIPSELKDYFQNRYLKYIGADKKPRERLELVKKIINIEWLAIYLYSITPEKIKIRKFSDKNFKENDYLNAQYFKFHNRLKNIEGTFL